VAPKVLCGFWASVTSSLRSSVDCDVHFLRRRSRWGGCRKVSVLIIRLNVSVAMDRISESVNGLLPSKNEQSAATISSGQKCFIRMIEEPM
jgi:hypothetical protein